MAGECVSLTHCSIFIKLALNEEVVSCDLEYVVSRSSLESLSDVRQSDIECRSFESVPVLYPCFRYCVTNARQSFSHDA